MKLLDQIDKLIASIDSDNKRHGGLLSRETIRASDELRVEVARERKINEGFARAFKNMFEDTGVKGFDLKVNPHER